MLKFVYLLPILQSWTCFMYVLPNLLQMLTLISVGTCVGNQ